LLAFHFQYLSPTVALTWASGKASTYASSEAAPPHAKLYALSSHKKTMLLDNKTQTAGNEYYNAPQ